MKLYQNPDYYEIAFSFRDIRQEVSFFEAAIKKFSQTSVRDVLELACGTSPYLEEWHRRGYQYSGLDVSPVMLRSGEQRARELGIEATLLQGDMTRFDLRNKIVDLAYVLLGSLYVDSNETFLGHLDQVAKVLRRGGLYVLDGVVNFKVLRDPRERWTMRRRGITTKTTFEMELLDPLTQLCKEHLTIEINDHGKRKTLRSTLLRKVFFPQELLLLLERHKKFEFVGWFKNFRLNRPRDSAGRTIAILRRR